MALRVQLVILASAFMASSTPWRVSCLPHVVLRAQLFVKWGHAPVPCGPRPTVWGTAPRWWCGVRLSERRKSLSLVQGQSPGTGSGAPPFPAICKNGSTCPRAPWSRQHCKWHTNGESCWCHWRLLVFIPVELVGLTCHYKAVVRLSQWYFGIEICFSFYVVSKIWFSCSFYTVYGNLI